MQTTSAAEEKEAWDADNKAKEEIKVELAGRKIEIATRITRIKERTGA